MRYIFILFCFTKALAQTPMLDPNPQHKLDTVFGDCSNARVVKLTGVNKVGKTIPPMGPGAENEIGSGKLKGKYFFEKEHHTAWYKLMIMRDGNLVFDIIPMKASDDYDFMLFKAGINFCDSLHNNRIEPIRSCISRDREDIYGRTGLSLLAKNELVKEGVGDAYCKEVKVTKGEIYYLVVDNVYENGDGHVIKFAFAEPVKIQGVLKDEEKQPVEADVTLVDQTGDTIVKTRSGKDGIYKFLAPVRQGSSYNLNFYDDKSFSFSKSFELKDTVYLQNLSLILPKLKKGKKHSVGSINFYPGETRYLPRAVPAIMNLYKLLQKNEQLKIMIIGHSNGRDRPEEDYIINFTKGRATSIKEFLVKKGIDPKRIEIDGKGDHEMLFALPQATQVQQELNRRVEIMVLDY